MPEQRPFAALLDLVRGTLAPVPTVLRKLAKRMDLWLTPATQGDVPAAFDGAPDHWIRMVRERAPHLLDGQERSVTVAAIAPRPAYQAPEQDALSVKAAKEPKKSEQGTVRPRVLRPSGEHASEAEPLARALSVKAASNNPKIQVKYVSSPKSTRAQDAERQDAKWVRVRPALTGDACEGAPVRPSGQSPGAAIQTGYHAAPAPVQNAPAPPVVRPVHLAINDPVQTDGPRQTPRKEATPAQYVPERDPRSDAVAKASVDHIFDRWPSLPPSRMVTPHLATVWDSSHDRRKALSEEQAL